MLQSSLVEVNWDKLKFHHNYMCPLQFPDEDEYWFWIQSLSGSSLTDREAMIGQRACWQMKSAKHKSAYAAAHLSETALLRQVNPSWLPKPLLASPHILFCLWVSFDYGLFTQHFLLQLNWRKKQQQQQHSTLACWIWWGLFLQIIVVIVCGSHWKNTLKRLTDVNTEILCACEGHHQWPLGAIPLQSWAVCFILPYLLC